MILRKQREKLSRCKSRSSTRLILQNRINHDHQELVKSTLKSLDVKFGQIMKSELQRNASHLENRFSKHRVEYKNELELAHLKAKEQ